MFNPYLYVRGNPVNLTDPSGRIAPLVAAGLYVGAAALIGGLVGGLVGGVGSLIHQLRQNGGDWSCLDVNAIADSALKSAIIGAIGGAAGALAALGFAAIGTAVGVGGSAAAGAMNVFASSVIGGQFARHTGALLYGGSYRPSLGDIALDGVLGVALFGTFAAGKSIWSGARGISSVARGVGREFGGLIPKQTPTITSQANPSPAKPTLEWAPGKSGDPARNVLNHWNRHKSEFPEIPNALQYAQRAQEFSSGTHPNFQIRSSSITRPPSTTPDMFYYIPSDNIIVMRNSFGVTTMYKPNPAFYQQRGYATAFDWFNGLK